LAGARVHNGILFPSVSNPKRLLASAINDASVVTLDVLIFGWVAFGGALVTATWVAAATAGALTVFVGAGVPERLGSVLTVRSFPCVSIIATGNSANFASRATGKRDFAREKRASTAGDEEVLRVQLYWNEFDVRCRSQWR
jgi:hypothetical protein